MLSLASLRPVAARRLAPAILALAAAIACVLVVNALNGPFSAYWSNDFKYFWLAGKIWNEGGSPYAPAYMEAGHALSASFSAPFYYPPAIRPLVMLLALAPMPVAATSFFILNLLLLALSVRLLASVATRLAPAADPALVLAALIILAFAGLRQPLIVASIGQMTIVFLAAASAYLYGALRQRPPLIALGLAVLLIKPHFGVALLVFSLISPTTRRPALWAVGAYSAATLFGLASDPLGSLSGFVANISQYTDHPTNFTDHSAGLSFILSLIGEQLPTAVTLMLLVAPVVLIRKPTTERAFFRSGLLVMVWSLFASPTHATDYVMLTPALLMIFIDKSMGRTILTLIVLIVLGRSYELFAATGLSADGRLFGITLVNTFALSALLVMTTARVPMRLPSLHFGRRKASTDASPEAR